MPRSGGTSASVRQSTVKISAPLRSQPVAEDTQLFRPSMIHRSPEAWRWYERPRPAAAIRHWRCRGFGGAKPGQRRTGLFEKWRQQPGPLHLRAADQERQQSKDSSDQGQGHAGIHRVELFDHDRGIDQTLALTTSGKRDALSQKSSRNHRLVGGSGRGKPFLCRRQRLCRQGRRQHFPCERARLELQFALPRGQSKINRHRFSFLRGYHQPYARRTTPPRSRQAGHSCFA